MTINKIDIHELIAKAKVQLDQEEQLSSSVRATIEMLFAVVVLLVERFGLNSKNSSTPPSADPNRKKKPRGKSERKPGGQHGHKGSTLSPVDEPDRIEPINVDQSTLPEGNYREVGYERRQVFDIDISRVITDFDHAAQPSPGDPRHPQPRPLRPSRPTGPLLPTSAIRTSHGASSSTTASWASTLSPVPTMYAPCVMHIQIPRL